MSELKVLTDELNQFMAKKFSFQDLPKIEFIEDKVNAHNTFGKTAHYEPATKKICLYTSNRHPKDILRSLAHEIVHHVQNLRGDLNSQDLAETNQDGYEQRNQSLYNLEEEAFSKGNMAFREWEHMKKSDKNLQEKKNRKKESKIDKLAKKIHKDDMKDGKKDVDQYKKAARIIKKAAKEDAKKDFEAIMPKENLREAKEETPKPKMIDEDIRSKELQERDQLLYQELLKRFTK